MSSGAIWVPHHLPTVVHVHWVGVGGGLHLLLLVELHPSYVNTGVPM